LSDLNSLRELMLQNGLIKGSNTEAASSEIIPFFDDIFGSDEGTDGISDCGKGCKEGCLTCQSGCSTCNTGSSTPS